MKLKLREFKMMIMNFKFKNKIKENLVFKNNKNILSKLIKNLKMKKNKKKSNNKKELKTSLNKMMKNTK
jgi:hypothetical protein